MLDKKPQPSGWGFFLPQEKQVMVDLILLPTPQVSISKERSLLGLCAIMGCYFSAKMDKLFLQLACLTHKKTYIPRIIFSFNFYENLAIAII
ncbi:MAG TPA: hypothetical protein ENI26_11705 [Methylophaga aminisulfidivorans]|uniref:Uncharacterized protein n=1 Tax=Methylophaga aminisulfidivorans TaxID=230105 RepID=A0A7C1W4N3_9GAMM|nr:hypothetical protein [Methylophaga aminisulfidivorans]